MKIRSTIEISFLAEFQPRINSFREKEVRTDWVINKQIAQKHEKQEEQ